MEDLRKRMQANAAVHSFLNDWEAEIERWKLEGRPERRNSPRNEGKDDEYR